MALLSIRSSVTGALQRLRAAPGHCFARTARTQQHRVGHCTECHHRQAPALSDAGHEQGATMAIETTSSLLHSVPCPLSCQLAPPSAAVVPGCTQLMLASSTSLRSDAVGSRELGAVDAH